MGAKISEVSVYLPEKIITNDELVLADGALTSAKISGKLGINQRHVVSENETSLDLGYNACLKILEKINKEAIEDIDRASAIVRSLVNLANRKTNQPVVLELVAATKEVVEVSRTRLRDEGVVVEINSPDRCYARVNPTEWQQVLINLLNNAIDSLQVSSKTTKQIVITLRQEADFIEMAIQDNGVGIPVGQEEKIFELLVSNKESGSGIGLWLTKDIIKRYQGEIFAKNIGDSGACFTVRLPALGNTSITA